MGASGAFLLSPFHMDNKLRAIGHFASHLVSRVGQPDSMPPKQALSVAARRHNAPGRLVFAIAKAESDFVPWRVSHTGAMGLMQLMPDTAAALGVEDPFHPRDNADGGAKYIAQLYRRYKGDIRRVAAAYNWGPGHVPTTGPYRVPPETRRYVDRVVRYANINGYASQ
ncbi:MAG: lytic transglycosylase domain-containing protein [Deltaproteobacteria bacterium]|nr:lytic transglycosylase domain-containing protein [Deltaproteobacteria bacterium]